MGQVFESVLDSIGNTPLIRIKTLCPNPKVSIYAKLESKNPGGSVKDRIALSMINAGEKSGELTPNKIVLEPTSGNTGIGLALVCAIKGYRLLLALPESVSQERRKILAAMGAQFTLTPGQKGTDGAIEVAYEMARQYGEKYFMPDQYNNPNNPLSHYDGTAVEIWEQTGGQITHFVATLGTSGTIMGNGKRLREFNPEVKIIAVEPTLGHKIQGLKNMKEAYVPGIFDKELPDEKIEMADEEAYETARQLALKEGIFVGMSSGAAMAAAIRKAREIDEGLIVCILPDGGERYLSTPLFTGVSLTEKERPVRGEIFLYNTLSRQVERFKPLSPEKVTMYSCGPTTDGPQHLGLLRRIVCTDLLVRLLVYRGYDVTHVMNITDIDDRTIAKSEEAGVALKEFTQANEELFFNDIRNLSVWQAAEYPRASEHTDDMVKMSQRLVDAGFAYEKQRSVYFDITRFAGYGKLSQIDLGKIRVGHTVDLDDYDKENPRDFALLKRAGLADWKKGYSFQTEWGFVRPSWHIECATMATKYLGDQLDIHTSSIDLLFPHHDNEIALVESLTQKQFANFWFHIEMVYAEGGKMAANTGNAVTLADCQEMGFSPRVVRYFLIGAHYRRALHFNEEALEQAAAALGRIDAFVQNLLATGGGESDSEIAEICRETTERFEDAMFEELKISKGLAAVFSLMRNVNSKMSNKPLADDDAALVIETLRHINKVLGFIEFEFAQPDAGIARLVKQREQARDSGDYELADQIRDELLALGVVIEDTKHGSRWTRR